MFFPATCPGEVHWGEDAGELVVIVRPDWFDRVDFQTWRQGRAGSEPATWNPNYPGADFDDVFMTFCRDRSAGDDYWEGSDVDNVMPEYVYVEIGRILREGGHHDGVLWLRAS